MKALAFASRAKAAAAEAKCWDAYRASRAQDALGRITGRNARTGQFVSHGETVRWSHVLQRADTGQWWIWAPADEVIARVRPEGELMTVEPSWFAR